MTAVMLKLRIWVHAETALLKINARRTGQRFTALAIALGLAILSVGMINIGIFELVAESYGRVKGAFYLAGGNGLLAGRFDPLSVPFLRVLKSVLDAGRDAGKPVTLCGELASRPISAMALVGLGFRAISMSPAAIGPVKAMLADLPVGELEGLMIQMLKESAVDMDVPARLRAFADEFDISCET